jgi:hypothetical protein
MGIDQPAPDDAGDGAADRGDRGDRGLDGGPPGPPNVSRAEQIAAHFRNRESVEAAYRAAADRDAWAAAAPRLRAEWEEHKQRYPERVRASPHTSPDGSWACGPHRRLDPEQNTEAGKAHADLADEAGRHILPAMRRIEAADPERRLAGLEHMVKGEDRLKEKLADAWHGRPDPSPLLRAAEHGDTMFDFVEISEDEANGIVARIRAEAAAQAD